MEKPQLNTVYILLMLFRRKISVFTCRLIVVVIVFYRRQYGYFRDIPKDCYQEVARKAFGTQAIEKIQFLSMQKEIDLSGYYYCEESYNL